MRGLLHPYGPLMTTLGKIGDAVILNLLVLLFSVPVVTMGAAVTAGHYTALKMLRNEESIFSDFWKSFCANLKQATCIWLGFLLLVTALAYIAYMGGVVAIAAAAVIVFVILVSLWVFPVLSKFVDSTSHIIRNSMVLSLGYFFRTLGMLLSYFVLPPLILISMNLLPVILLFGLSVPMLISAMLYNPVFLQMEEKILEN